MSKNEAGSLTTGAGIDEIQDKYKDILVDQDAEEKEVILKKGVNWDSFGDAYISKTDFEKVTLYDSPASDRVALLEKDGSSYARIMMILLAKLQPIDTLRYVLTLVDDMVHNEDVPKMISAFEELGGLSKIEGVPSLPFGPLFALLDRKKEDPYISSKVYSILSRFLLKFSSLSKDTVDNTIDYFIDRLNNEDPEGPHYYRFISIPSSFFSSFLLILPLSCIPNASNNRKIIRTLETLRDVLLKNEYRIVFNDQGGLSALHKFIRYEEETGDPFKVQLLYASLYCLWILSFNEKTKAHITDPSLIRNLCHILRRMTSLEKIKVIRMDLAVFRNLLNCGKNNELMITYGLLKTITQMKNFSKKWGDDDIIEDMEFLEENLERIVYDLTSFESYKNEVLSAKLEWSPCHKSERFWKENSLHFEQQDFLCLRKLKDILLNSKDPQSLMIVCWDIGEFVRFHPRGKHIVQQLDLKIPIMTLLSESNNKEIQQEALLALQKLMVTNWEYLSLSADQA